MLQFLGGIKGILNLMMTKHLKKSWNTFPSVKHRLVFLSVNI